LSQQETLQKLYCEGITIVEKKLTKNNVKFVAWRARLEQFFHKEYGENSYEYKTLHKLQFESIASIGAGSRANEKDAAQFKNDMGITLSLIEGRLEEEKSIEESCSLSDSSKDVFIIHGHDDGARETVENFIRQIGYNPIVLFKEASRGKTVIEKIEQYTESIAFGIAIYTPCDIGKAQKESDFKNRSRQNVVFEHGFLAGKYGRANVVGLVKGDIELPSDLAGIAYISMDVRGAWKYDVAKEMIQAGFNVDMNKIK